MDMKLFIKALSEEEKQKALWHLRAWNHLVQEKIGKKIGLTESEQEMVDSGGEIQAIKSVRERTGNELLACRYAVKFSRKP